MTASLRLLPLLLLLALTASTLTLTLTIAGKDGEMKDTGGMGMGA